LHEEDQHLFVLHWGLNDYELEHFPTPLDSPWVAASERLVPANQITLVTLVGSQTDIPIFSNSSIIEINIL